MLTYINEKRASLEPTLWVVFILYALVSSYAISRHELWSDELHSWNIAKASIVF